MITFERLDGPHGIPVYFQKLPELVNSVSLRWVMFVGSADDEDAGAPGVYHWFEHVPFRGTRKFPGGYAATQGRFSRYGGYVGAHTGHTRTAYDTFVPKRLWKEALELITDLMAQPLLGEDAIVAERQIIREELNTAVSEAQGRAMYDLPSLLWPGHPLGHDALGTEATLYAMDPALLTKAQEQAYTRSRCVLLVAGDIPRDELLDAIASCAEVIPQRPLSERRATAAYGPLPVWKEGRVTEVATSFPTSVTLFLFPVPPLSEDGQKFLRWVMLKQMCETGELSSPLLRLLREERKLVYHTEVSCRLLTDGGFWGFSADARSEHVPDVRTAFRDVLHDPQLRSPDWYEYVKDAVRGVRDMRVVHPHHYTEEGEERLVQYGSPLGDDELVSRLTALPHAGTIQLLDTLTPERAHTIIFRGSGKAG